LHGWSTPYLAATSTRLAKADGSTARVSLCELESRPGRGSLRLTHNVTPKSMNAEQNDRPGERDQGKPNPSGWSPRLRSRRLRRASLGPILGGGSSCPLGRGSPESLSAS